jgi:hypothetical protein
MTREQAELLDLAESLAAAVLDGDRSSASALAQTLTARVRKARKGN